MTTETAEFDIETYLNSLPDGTIIIDVSYKNITYIPSLSRFYNLQHLYCNRNKLTSLPELNSSLQFLNCSYNHLTSMPEISHTSLTGLKCSYNKLTSLPKFNSSLKILDCSYNQLTSLPELNCNLKHIICNVNKLTSLPNLNDCLYEFDCSHNPLTEIPTLKYSLRHLTYYYTNIPYNLLKNQTFNYIQLNEQKINEINHNTVLIKHCKFTYMCVKYKQKFRDWLWIKVRLPKIEQKYHPDVLDGMLKDNDDIERVISTW